MEDGTTIRSLAEVLSILGGEISSLAGIAEGLQPILALACSGPGADPRLSRTIQTCDLLTQKLEAIGGVIIDLCDTLSAGYEVDIGAAIGNIRLSGLAATLSQKQTSPADQREGEVELF